MILQNTIRLAISDEFFSAYSALPRSIQDRVSKFINRFRKDPTDPGIHYENITNANNKAMKSVRINKAYRAIMLKPERGNIYILLWVDHHDDAYDWAQRKNCVVNEVSGALQIVDIKEAEAKTQQLAKKNNQNNLDKDKGLFDTVKDKHLMRLGVPEILLPAVRQVVTDSDLDQLMPHLPKEASEALTMLGAGYALDEVFNQIEKSQEPEKIDPEDLEKALENPDSLSRFMVVTDDIELEEMLAAPLEKWRVFLHPSQRKIVERDWLGALRVLGGAGTGKTVVAMHRAKWLAQNRFTDPSDRILFTTFTRNLAVDIEANLKTICSIELMRRIQVVNLDAWVTQFLRQEGVNTRIVYDTKKIWKEAYTIAPVELGLSEDFYKDEWQAVVLNQDCQTLKDYLRARRVGRGTRLDRKQRQAIWPVFEEYRNLLREQNLREPDEAFREVAKIITLKGQESLPYRAVIVDEAQDMSPAAFVLIRAIAGPSHKNDLFIVGDAHQRIYGKKVTLRDCGIEIRGRRSRKLRLNYRTTDEICRWATAIVENMAVDDLDGGSDSLKDYRSVMYGEAPVIKGFKYRKEELDFMKETLVSIQKENSTLSGVCVAFRTNDQLDSFESVLQQNNIPVKRIQRNQPDNPLEEGVRIGTMHRVKGLQFNYMFIPSLNADILPLPIGLAHCADKASEQRFRNGERSLLHVAATRAKKQIFISYIGEPSPILKAS
ncbi:MAG: UvrD-helicase domain-containing protein [Cyanobacteria bacterium J06634_5]